MGKYFWATHSRLPPITDAAHTVKRHWDGFALIRQQDRHRPDRRHQQQLSAGRKGESSGLPLNPKPQGHDLPAGRKA
jgi:hypothetical protein